MCYSFDLQSVYFTLNISSNSVKKENSHLFYYLLFYKSKNRSIQKQQ